jgi:hypothetical protein
MMNILTTAHDHEKLAWRTAHLVRCGWFDMCETYHKHVYEYDDGPLRSFAAQVHLSVSSSTIDRIQGTDGHEASSNRNTATDQRKSSPPLVDPQLSRYRKYQVYYSGNTRRKESCSI